MNMLRGHIWSHMTAGEGKLFIIDAVVDSDGWIYNARWYDTSVPGSELTWRASDHPVPDPIMEGHAQAYLRSYMHDA